jgi:hypothetical protein
MNIYKKYAFKYCFPSLFLLYCLVSNLSAIDTTVKNIYREKVFLNPGHDTYITGEDILLQAFCQNVNDPAKPVLSKVLYVELINEKNEHILGQVLYLKENMAESKITIPDTLQSGLYYLKSYTQWMTNFGPESFFSTPLFIFNQFDEKSPDQSSLFRIPSESNIFLDGLGLIAGCKTKIEVSFPELKGNETNLNIFDSNDSATVTTFKLDNYGEGMFEFTPKAGHKYLCVNKDSSSIAFYYNLPQVSNTGYKIDIISVNEKNVTINIKNYNEINQKLVLEITPGNSNSLHKEIRQDEMEKEIVIPYISNKYVVNELLLKDSFGKILTKNEFIYLPKNPLNLQSLQNNYKTREPIYLEVILDKNAGLDTIYASVSIHKTKPSFQSQNEHISLMAGHSDQVRYLNIQDNFYSVLSRFNSGAIQPKYNSVNPDMNSFIPLEDMGILITGTILDANQNPVPELNIILSAKDTVPDLQSATTDDKGKFAFLINKTGTQRFFFHVFKNSQPLNDPIAINLDNKFYYLKNSVKSETIKQVNDMEFVTDLTNEAKRVLIQRVFAKKENNDKITTSLFPQPPSYFDNSVLTVYPDDFFDMPNFEEIAREILPLVRYRKSNDGCSISIFNPDPGTRSTIPLVLVDGVPIINKCDLYNLNSGKIRKIKIQSQPRIVGNLYYDGLVAISSYPDKEFKYSEDQNGYSFVISGFNAVKKNSDKETNEELKNKSPKFKNQMYWNTLTIDSKNKNEIRFNTSDEEGEYVFEINGLSKNGLPVHYQQIFTVTAK